MEHTCQCVSASSGHLPRWCTLHTRSVPHMQPSCILSTTHPPPTQHPTPTCCIKACGQSQSMCLLKQRRTKEWLQQRLPTRQGDATHWSFLILRASHVDAVQGCCCMLGGPRSEVGDEALELLGNDFTGYWMTWCLWVICVNENMHIMCIKTCTLRQRVLRNRVWHKNRTVFKAPCVGVAAKQAAKPTALEKAQKAHACGDDHV